MEPTKRVIASFPEYGRAQHAVDALADRRFAVDRLAIVGAGLQSYEQITGRKGYGKAAAQGLVSGAVIGALIGWLLGLFSLVEPLVAAAVLAVWGIAIGGAIGILVGVVGHAMTGGRRDFSSIDTVRAERYDVLADEEVAEEAQRTLAEVGPMPAESRS